MKIQSWYCGDDCRLRYFVFDDKNKCLGRYDHPEEIAISFPELAGSKIEFIDNENNPNKKRG